MFAVLNDQRLHEFTDGAPRSLAELRSKFESLAAGQSPDGREAWLNWVVRRIDGPAIGYVQAGVADGSAAVAWVIGAPWQGQGFASEAATAMAAWLIARGVTEIRAAIQPLHTVSNRVAEHLGLTETAEVVDGEVIWAWYK